MKRTRAPSPQTLAVLYVLLETRNRGVHGYELIKTLGIKSGTLYPLLMRLVDQNLLDTEWQEPSAPGRPPRQIYRLTASGITYAEQHLPESQRIASPATGPATA